MDKDEAGKILAKSLAEKFGREIIVESSCKQRAIENSKYYKQMGGWISLVEFYNQKFHIHGLSNPDLSSLLIEYDRSFEEANYLFLENFYEANQKTLADLSSPSRFWATPIALIGDKEVKSLKNLFYKDVSQEIVNALEHFKIDNFITRYKAYSSLNNSFEKNKNLEVKFNVYRKFNEGEKIELEDIIQSSKDRTYFLVKELKSCGIKGHVFDNQFTTVLKNHKNELVCCCKENINPHLKCVFNIGKPKADIVVLDEDFLSFVINLPPEDHNVAVNKLLLKNIKDPYMLDLVINEYRNDGKQFQEYFSCLPSENQKKVIAQLNSLNKRTSHIDYFLWKQGFNINFLDYLDLYRENSEDFIKYFKSRDYSEQRTILSDLLNCEDTNEQVISWLDENYSYLIKDVGLDPNQ